MDILFNVYLVAVVGGLLLFVYQWRRNPDDAVETLRLTAIIAMGGAIAMAIITALPARPWLFGW